MKNSHPQWRVGIIQSNGQKTVALVIDDRQLTDLPSPILLTDTFAEEPRVAGSKLRLRGRRDPQAKAWLSPMAAMWRNPRTRVSARAITYSRRPVKFPAPVLPASQRVVTPVEAHTASVSIPMS